MESFVNTAQQLIAIPSTADHPAALCQAVDFIAAQLSANKNITIERFESNGKPSLLAYKGKRRPASFRMLLNGHVDVVPAKKEQFTPKIRNGRLYGRGALDMKVAALALTHVFRDMVDTVPYALGLQIVTDEEIGGENGTAYQLAQGVNAQLAIAGESTPRGAVCNESRGFYWAEIEFHGTTAHSAYPWNGTNAILLAQEFTQKLLAAMPTPPRDAWCSTTNIATMSTSNATFNKVPDQARLGIDIRFIPNDIRFASRRSATDFLQQLAPKNSTVQVVKFEPSHFADPQNSDLQVLARAIAETTGKPTRFIRKHGAADIRFFSQQNIPGVTFGLQGEGQHSDNEFVEIDSIKHYVTALTNFLRTIN